MKQWKINIPDWILKDGNYRDFYCGQIAEFALELYVDSLETCEKQPVAANLIDLPHYQVTAEVVYISEKVDVIDLGVCAYMSTRKSLSGIKTGDFLTGKIRLGVDPFFYFESHYKLSNIPPLIYTWQIDKITLCRGKYITTKNSKGEDILEASSLEFEEVEKTDVWGSGAKKPDYTLFGYTFDCTKLDVEPKYQKSKK